VEGTLQNGNFFAKLRKSTVSRKSVSWHKKSGFSGLAMLSCFWQGGGSVADLRTDIENALTYLEANLTEKLEIRDIAKQACLSPFYFQRVFVAMCGISVGEYSSGRLVVRGKFSSVEFG
jgi:hypothetical protein